MFEMRKVTVMNYLGKTPFLGDALRRLARLYSEGSVTRIRAGYLAGCRWQRSHRYVNGYWLGTYESATQECLIRELRPGAVFYDIGANAGFFTLLGCRCVGPQGRVFSFEPLPENAAVVRSQLQVNSVDNCTVVEAAVTDHVGIVGFCRGQDTSTAHIQRADDRLVGAVEAKAVTLDDFVRTAPSPQFIKMDTEGAELSALKGACRLLGGVQAPKMLIEFHGEQLRQECMAILRSVGYLFCSLDGRPRPMNAHDRHVLCIPQRAECANR
jgi:FkbM family methyltransferase